MTRNKRPCIIHDNTMQASLILRSLHINFLCSLTIFFSAFLLFQIQPMIGRSILPLFGGAATVWGVMLVFFTGELFLGYLYVYLLHKLSMRIQAVIHLILIVTTTLLVALITLYEGSLFIPFSSIVESALHPAFQVLLVLFVSIGVPYFVLSTTSPLLQQWYGARGEDPYHLYALSNLGSLIALGTYPFVVEPLFSLSTQYAMWVILFLLYGVMCMVVALLAKRAHGEAFTEKVATGATPKAIQATWLWLAMVPAAMLVATTAHITQIIAPTPFFWVIPLLIYLATLILAFRGWGGNTGGLIAFLVAITAGISLSLADYSYYEAKTEIVANLALFFFGSLYCHSLLYSLRPRAEGLSYYYLLISLGGWLGTLFMSMAAPLLFKDFFEFVLGIGLLIMIVIIFFPTQRYLRDAYARHDVVVKALSLFVVAFFVAQQYYSTADDGALYTTRNFYGQVRIRNYADRNWFSHGTTIHGSQFTDKDRADEPTTYYTPPSGVARALSYAQALRGKAGIRVGILGLGAGSIAAHCRPNDEYVFYEIDPRVEDVARTYFTYLKNCEHASVRYGDGRLVLEKELREGKKGNYDVLVIAAFSDDTLPTHLMTKESVSLYLENLRDPQSILTVITSTRYIELTAVVLRIASELGLSSKYIYDDGELYEGGTRSDWVLMSRDQKMLLAPSIAEIPEYTAGDTAFLWTDDYVNVFGAMRLPEWYFWNEE